MPRSCRAPRARTSAPARSPWSRRRARSRRPGRTRRRTSCRSRASTLPRPTESMLASPASARRTFSGSSPAPSSSTSIDALLATVVRRIVIVPDPSAASSPCRTAFSTSGWMHEERHRHRQHLGRDAERHRQPVAEPRLLEQQVALDRAELLGQGREVAVPAERVAGEVGELQQQLARPVGVGAHEATRSRRASCR